MQLRVYRGCCPFVRCLIPKKKDAKKDSEDTYRINPVFKRMTITAKNNNRVVSEMLGIDDSYTAFAIDETSDYLYQQLVKESRLKNQNDKNQDDLQTMMGKYSTKKKRK